MKKILFYAMSLFLVAATSVGCGDSNDNDEGNNPDGGDTVFTLDLQIDGESVTSATLGSDTDSTLEVEAVVNQSAETLVVDVDDAGELWCEATLDGTTITFTALSEYAEGDYRECVAEVTVGDGDTEVSKELTITQYKKEVVIFEVDPASVELKSYADDTATVEVTTNQENLAIELSDETNFSAELDGTTITITTLGTNSSMTDPITATLTVSVGEGDNAQSQDIAISQAAMEVATVSVEPTSVALDNMLGNNEKIYVTTNQDPTTIAATFAEGKFDVTIKDNYVTVAVSALNTSLTEEISDTLTITVGSGENTASIDVPVTQAVVPAATVSVEITDMPLENILGSSASTAVTTNQSMSTIVATIDDETNFEVSVEETVVTVKALTINTEAEARTATVTIKVGPETNPAQTTFTVSQSNEVLLAVEPMEVSLGSDAGSVATFAVETNQATFTAVPADATNFSATIEGGVVTITAINENTTGAPINTTVAITAGEGALATTQNVIVTQRKILTVANIGDLLEGGIVFWVSEDLTQAKVVSLTESTGAYSTNTTTLYSDATDLDNGAANTAAILASSDYNAETFPAFAWCASLGEGWYFPATNEAAEFFMQLGNSTFVDAFAANSATPIQPDFFYWVSTGDATTASKANAVKYKTAELNVSIGSYGRDKVTRGVRAIKLVNL